jgi:hypothetical protein
MELYSRPASFDDLKTLTIDLDGIPVRTVNLQGLLLTKQTARDKDIADRIVLERALAVLNAHSGKP